MHMVNGAYNIKFTKHVFLVGITTMLDLSYTDYPAAIKKNPKMS